MFGLILAAFKNELKRTVNRYQLLATEKLTGTGVISSFLAASI